MFLCGVTREVPFECRSVLQRHAERVGALGRSAEIRKSLCVRALLALGVVAPGSDPVWAQLWAQLATRNERLNLDACQPSGLVRAANADADDAWPFATGRVLDLTSCVIS